ncbi:MAG: sodium/solute symporter [Planctomycetes bacterium]|nr:sodium/solute symporter [Planctomycetota bacterium]
MALEWLDIAIFAAFFTLVVGVSLFKSRCEKSSEDYFLAGRGLTWPLIGFSIVAANLSTEQFVGMAGQSAGDVGLAVSAWQLTGAVGIVIIAFTFLPRFLKAGIYTMPEYLEYRYNAAARGIMALFTTIIYVTVTITAVLYSGGLTLSTIFGLDLRTAIWIVGAIAAIYTTWGGLKAVAWADLFQGAGLMIGGLATMYVGFRACGGVFTFFEDNADRLHMILPAKHATLPWTGVLAGMWIPIVYYCGLNQFIVQRTLAARNLRQGQLGIIFAAALWLLVPFAIVLPGIMAQQLYGETLTRTDEAYPTLIRSLIPAGVRGFMFAAISGAVISSLASMLNSASTICTMDLYRRHLRPQASQRGLVLIGRALTLLFVIIGCLLAPALADPHYKGVFNFIQEFQGYISPGIVAAFVVGFALPRAPRWAGAVALLTSAPVYGGLHLFLGGGAYSAYEIHFLIRMLLTFVTVALIMLAMTLSAPLSQPRRIPVRADFDATSSSLALILGGIVIVAVVAFFIVFW